MWKKHRPSHYVKCPICGEDSFVIKHRTYYVKNTNSRTINYIIKCPTHGEQELSTPELDKAAHECKQFKRDWMNGKLGLPTKGKEEKRKKDQKT